MKNMITSRALSFSLPFISLLAAAYSQAVRAKIDENMRDKDSEESADDN